MKIGITFYGVMSGKRPDFEGSSVKSGSERDIRHCWPDYQKMLIDPYIEKGHEVKTYLSTYPIEDPDIQDYIDNTIKPTKIHLSKKEGSTPFTCKGACLPPLYDQDLDFVIICRGDMHLHKPIAEETTIHYDKFNFLFKELGYWEQLQFTTDNFYMFPFHMIRKVDIALAETFPGFPRGWPMVDTHGLYHTLTRYIPVSDINFISDKHELSAICSYYTLCKAEIDLTMLPNSLEMMHPAVKKKFYNDL